MLSTVVLVLVCNLCCTRAVSLHPEQRGDIISHDLLLELRARMDVKDAEINELRANQKQQDENTKKLMLKIGVQDETINDLRKKVNTHESVINAIELNQKTQELLLKELHQTVLKLQSSSLKFTRKIQRLHVSVQNLLQTTRDSHLQEKARQRNDETTTLADMAPRLVNRSAPVTEKTPNDESRHRQKERDANTQSVGKRHAGTDLVAFFATLSKQAMVLGVGQNLLFDHVITNIGSAYNPHLGGFIAPVSGVYVLMSTLVTYQSLPGHNEYFKLVQNGNAVCYMYAVNSGNQYDTASGSFVLYLNKGDVIAIQNAQAADAVHGSDFSYFSGFLLKELEQGPGIVG